MKDDSIPSALHLLYLDIPCDYSTFDFPYENSFPNVSTSACSHDTSDFSLSLQHGEDTSSSENMSHFSYIIYENVEGEHPYFSSTPLHNSSNHKDAKENLEFSKRGCRDLCTSSFDHDVDSLVVNMSRSLMIYLSTKLKPHRLSRHFSPR